MAHVSSINDHFAGWKAVGLVVTLRKVVAPVSDSLSFSRIQRNPMSTTSKLSGESFLGLVKQSGLIDQEMLKKTWKEIREQGLNAADPVALSEEFLKRNLLTRWQVDNLLRGKHKGFLLGKYRLLSLLGSGGMSQVFLAEHILMRRRVAIKVLPKSRVDDSSYLQRFHREAQAVAALDHRNIVRAYDVDQEDKTHFLVMEYVAGQSLQELVGNQGVLDPVAAAEYTRQAAEGLHHAHRAGMVHRDIKPGNLLLDEKGTIKLLDLGLARFFNEGDESSLTRQHDERVLGTADYLSPEQALDSHLVDVRSDVYSLGCTLYFMLTGNPPFPEGTMAQRLLAHQTKQPTPINTLRPDAPPGLVAIVDMMMAKKPDERYQSAKDAAQALLQWLTENGGATWTKMNPIAAGGNSVIVGGVSGISGHSSVLSGETAIAPRASAPGSSLGGSSIGVGGPAQEPGIEFNFPPPEKSGFSGRSTKNVASAMEATAEPELAAFLTQMSGAGNEQSRSAPPRPAAEEMTRIAPPDDARFAATITNPATDQGATLLNPEQTESPFAATAPEVAWPEGPMMSATFANADAVSKSAAAAQPTQSMSATPPVAIPVAAPVSAPSTAKRRSSAPVAAPVAPPAAGSKTKLIIAGMSGAMFVLLALVGYLAFGRGDSGKESKKESKTSAENKKPKKEPAGPIPFSGRREIAVGPTAQFKSIGAALEDTKKYASKSRNSAQIIRVAGGQTYAERIVIDDSFPRGIQIVVPEGEEATLAPAGPGAIVIVGGGEKSVEDFKLEGFRIDASGKDVAVQFADWIPGAQLKRLQITGYAKSGVMFQGVQSYHNKLIMVEDVKFGQCAPDAAAILLKKSKEDPSHIKIARCRFVGPMAAGVLLQSQAIDVEIAESIFHQLDTAVKFEGEARVWRDIVFASNTFFQNNRAIDFTNMPAAGSIGFGFYNNLFVAQKTGDVVVEKDLKMSDFPEMYTKRLAGAAYNWTDKPVSSASADALTIIFESWGGKSGVADLQFASTDPSNPEFLAPAATSSHRSVGSIDDKRFGRQIGAIRPR